MQVVKLINRLDALQELLQQCDPGQYEVVTIKAETHDRLTKLVADARECAGVIKVGADAMQEVLNRL